MAKAILEDQAVDYSKPFPVGFRVDGEENRDLQVTALFRVRGCARISCRIQPFLPATDHQRLRSAESEFVPGGAESIQRGKFPIGDTVTTELNTNGLTFLL